jgi:hypothetical protein
MAQSDYSVRTGNLFAQLGGQTKPVKKTVLPSYHHYIAYYLLLSIITIPFIFISALSTLSTWLARNAIFADNHPLLVLAVSLIRCCWLSLPALSSNGWMDGMDQLIER